MPVELTVAGLLTLLVVVLSILWQTWRSMSKPPCPPAAEEEEKVKFLLTKLIESRWSELAFKLLYRRLLHLGLMIADDPPKGDRAAAARAKVTPELISLARRSSAIARGQAAAASMGYLPLPASPAVDLQVDVRVTPPSSPPDVVPTAEQPETSSVATMPTRPASIPFCPQCHKPMLMRRNRTNHGLFWGCCQYPKCQGTRRPWDDGSELA